MAGDPFDLSTGWLVGLVDLSGRAAVIRVNGTLRDVLPSERFAQRLVVRVATAEPGRDGFPTPAGQIRLDAVEDYVTRTLVRKRYGVLGAVVTSTEEFRDLLLWLEDTARVDRWAKTLAATFPDERLSVRGREDRSGTVYFDMLRLVEDAAADARVIEKLKDNGADLAALRQIDHFLVFRDSSAARDARAFLLDHDYEVPEPRETSDAEWTVVASHHERAHPQVISHLRQMFEQFCADRGATYDGWGASARP